MSEKTKENGTQEVTIKYDSWLLKLIKTHGLSVALMLTGIYFLNSKLTLAENRITALENRLYDCYEKRISASAVPFGPCDHFPQQQYAILPENKKKRHDYTLI